MGTRGRRSAAELMVVNGPPGLTATPEKKDLITRGIKSPRVEKSVNKKKPGFAPGFFFFLSTGLLVGFFLQHQLTAFSHTVEKLLLFSSVC
jgi:hypothetical protein